MVTRREGHLPKYISSKLWRPLLPRSLIYLKEAGSKRGRPLLCFNRHGRKTQRLTGHDQLLGKGTFCRVKEVMDLETGNIFALAVQGNSSSAREEFEDQLALQGPGIARVYGYAVWNGDVKGKRVSKMGVVMSRYQRDLFSHLTSQARASLSFKHRLQLALDVFKGLDRIHKAGKIHGDIKPKNILIDCQERAFIADFGHMQTVNQVKRLSIGSPRYHSPEYRELYGRLKKNPRDPALRTECRAAITYAVDEWAVGLVLWHLFATELAQGNVFNMTFRDFYESNPTFLAPCNKFFKLDSRSAIMSFF